MSTIEWGTDQEMNELEASMWRAEVHPRYSTQGGILEIFDGTPDYDTVRGYHETGVASFRRFRQRVVEPAVPVGPPRWVDDEHFNLDYHLRRVTLPGEGTMQDLLTLCQALGSTPLARNRALWAATFIEGLEGGKSAYWLTVHHCLMDGHASIQLLSRLHLGMDPGEIFDVASDGKAIGPAQLAAEQTIRRLKDAPKFAGKLVAGAADAVRKGPVENVKFAQSVGRVLAPAPEAGSELLRAGARSAWRYGVLECQLADLKAAGKSIGGTVNDAYVASVMGGVRRYHVAHGESIEDININMPVSVRRDDDKEGGNKFAAAFINVPVLEDPAERMQALRKAVAAVRGEPALDFFSLLLPVVNRSPSAILTPLFTGMQDRANMTSSNVPGLPKPVKFAGVPVKSMYYFGPLPGGPVMTVLCSYAGTCCIGINCDGDVFADPQELFDCIRAELDDVLALSET